MSIPSFSQIAEPDDASQPSKKWGFSLSSLSSKISAKAKPFTVYTIQFRQRLTSGKMSDVFVVTRRYNDFELLHAYVKSLDTLRGCVVPDLPQKTYYGFKDETEKSEDRRV